MIKCPLCQFENEDGALFCEQCKSDLSATETAPATSPAAPPEPVSADVAAASTIPVAAVIIEAAGAAEAVPVVEVASDIGVVPAVVAEAVPLAEAPAGIAPLEVAAPAGGMEATAAAPVEATAAPAAAADARPKLIVVRGQRINAEYPLYEGENFIGRSDEKAVDVDLEDQEPPDRIWSSRQHALIVFENGQLSVEDLNSTNGTFVNRTRVHPGQKRPLQANDVIQIGTVHLKVKV
jgi:hypothetical protein